LKFALQRLFRARDERWWGVRTGIVADIDGVPDALRKLNEAIIGCYVEGGVKQEISDSNATISAPARPSNKPIPANRPSGNTAANMKKNPVGRPGSKNHEVITID
jgi:mediator of RNA polymerase II transcription subunit 14